MPLAIEKTDTLTSADWYQDFIRFVQRKGLTERSHQAYCGWVRQLIACFPGEDIPALPPQRVLDFLIHLRDERKRRPSTLNQAVCAVRTLYRDHLGLNWDIRRKIHIQHDEPLPHLLTRLRRASAKVTIYA
ncbi:MAG: phage integrase N-terminal SAM-like domain-containing protein [Verrucomicrobiales bacterium]|nr:phage integrase N-terminal SAM-like domain-containing protein [Verrucomicrobiales bacterium]